MKINIKQYVTKKNITILATVALLITIGTFISKANKDIAETKKQLIESELKANTKSDIEILENKAAMQDKAAKNHLNEIEEYKELIVEHQNKYEESILKERCYKSQINRKIDWLEYNLNYCDNKDNLNQYKIKKY